MILSGPTFGIMDSDNASQRNFFDFESIRNAFKKEKTQPIKHTFQAFTQTSVKAEQ
jgi:hypothetical protein